MSPMDTNLMDPEERLRLAIERIEFHIVLQQGELDVIRSLHACGELPVIEFEDVHQRAELDLVKLDAIRLTLQDMVSGSGDLLNKADIRRDVRHLILQASEITGVDSASDDPLL